MTYLPPNGIYFRLIGRESRCALYSSNAVDDQFGQNELSAAEDQLFTLVHGTGAREGTYAIKGKESGRILFARRVDGNPLVGHEEGESDDDNYFTFTKGTDEQTGAFRIMCPATHTVIYSSMKKNPAVGNSSSEDHAASDQYFEFQFEELVATNVVFDIDAGHYGPMAISIGEPQVYTNTSDTDVLQAFTIGTLLNSDFAYLEYGGGFPLAVGTQLCVTFPIAVHGKLRQGHSEVQYAFGTDLDMSQVYGGGGIAGTIKPQNTATATGGFVAGRADAPYTITLTSRGGVETTTTGTWYATVSEGVTTYSISVTKSSVPAQAL